MIISSNSDWIGILFLAISKVNFSFSSQIFLKASGNPSSYTYLIQFGIQATQLISLTWINNITIYKRKLSVIFSVFILISSSILILIFENILIISLISAATRLFFGRNRSSWNFYENYVGAWHCKKYNTIFEIIIGIGFGLTPIIAGYVAEMNIYFMFFFLILLDFAVLFSLVYISRDVTKN